jgi:hypothetical protein
MAGFSGRLNLDDKGVEVLEDTLIVGTVGGVDLDGGVEVLEDTLIAGTAAGVDLGVGAGVLEGTLIVGTGGGVKVFLGRSSTVFIVGTAGEVTALDKGRVPGAC